jgi:translation initiation factor 1 (eIF-1/SUI1)
MDDRKKLLKEMKSKFGVGGTLVDGVLEIQGSFAVEAVEILKKNGCSQARKIGK